VTPVITYCGEYYNAEHAWKDLQAEEEEYRKLLTLQEKNINTIQNIPLTIPHIPNNTIKENTSKKYIRNIKYFNRGRNNTTSDQTCTTYTNAYHNTYQRYTKTKKYLNGYTTNTKRYQ